MAIPFNPPEWLIREYFNQKDPYQQASEGIGQAIGTYATLKQTEADRKLKAASVQREQEMLELAKNKDAREVANQDFQRQVDYGYDPENPGQFWNDFRAKYPQGIKGREKQSSTDPVPLVHPTTGETISMIPPNAKVAPASGFTPPKPQMRQNAFSGEWEWYAPPTDGAPQAQVAGSSAGTVAAEASVPARAPHGPGTFRDRSKAAGIAAEDQALMDSVSAEISRIKELNKNSRGGVLGQAMQRGQSALNMGTDSPEFRNTADVINTLKSQVARVLKSTFGGQLSDSERAYMNEVYGAAESMTPQEREIAMTNVLTTLASKAKTSGAKYRAISGMAPNSGGVPGGGNSDPLGIR